MAIIDDILIKYIYINLSTYFIHMNKAYSLNNLPSSRLHTITNQIFVVYVNTTYSLILQDDIFIIADIRSTTRCGDMFAEN